VSYNCKNVKTSSPAIVELFRHNDIVLIQEHWLFHFQINLLEQIHEDINAAGKGADMNNPIHPMQIPRGYGGVAILWKKHLDKFVKPLPDGGERIQCLEITNGVSRPVLLVSIYLPTKGYSNSLQSFQEVIDQLYEIIQKFQVTHDIILGGDVNEDLVNIQDRSRYEHMKEFIEDCSLQYNTAGKTYINPKGEECTEIDYFLYSKSLSSRITKTKVIKNLCANVSDHYPISIACEMNFEYEVSRKRNNTNTHSVSKPNWDKVDKDMYTAMVNLGVTALDSLTAQTTLNPELYANEISRIMSEAAVKCAPTRKRYAAKPKLKTWNLDIAKSVKLSKECYIQWKNNGRPNDSDNPLVIAKKQAKKELRSKIRQESARQLNTTKEEIMNARTFDTKLFHKLIRKQRKTGSDFITDLHVNGQQYTGNENVIQGFKTHFEQLACVDDDLTYDEEFNNIVQTEYESLVELTRNKQISHVSLDEVKSAIKSINRGKSADIYGLTIEHIDNSDDRVIHSLQTLINRIFKDAEVPDALKVGLLTPIFKNKGSRHESKYYRGITVLPVMCKLIDTILKQRILPLIEHSQSPLQRGFTAGISPLNASLLVEECYRNCKDEKKPLSIVLLDAKSAFDVVNHKNMMRRLYHIGVTDNHWQLINSLHTNATTSVKWASNISETFSVSQGIRQGGIMSADLYKIYIDPLLHRLHTSGIGTRIGDVECPASACADDVTLNSCDPVSTQILMDIAYDFSVKQRYKLQPEKTVILSTEKNVTQTYTLGTKEIDIVKEATHLGIIRGSSIKETLVKTIESNIKKARRTAYSLMAAGLHGENGLDPPTSLHLLKTYVSPVLLYGMEILIPPLKFVQQLELFQKKLLKQILSVPQNTADAAIYILTGFLPIQEQIDIKVLNFYNNICLQDDEQTEKNLARRQLTMKDPNSASWFSDVRKIFWKYDLTTPETILDNPYSKQEWKTIVFKAVSSITKERITSLARLYKSLQHMNVVYTPGRIHPNIDTRNNSVREINRLSIKMKLLTGAYILQSNRVSFNQNEVDPTCQMCGKAPEHIQHFILDCEILETFRQPILCEIVTELRTLTNEDYYSLNKNHQTDIILDCTHIKTQKNISKIEFHCRRLLYSLHCARYRMLNIRNSRR